MSQTIIMNCVNCDKYITDLRESCLVLEQNTKVISQIAKWISPQILTKTDNLCQACWNLAIEVINMKNESYDDIQPDNSQSENDTDPLKVKTEIPSAGNEEIETSQINNTFEKDPLKVEPEDTDLNNESNEEELSHPGNEETESDHIISAKRKKLDTHITTNSDVEINDHEYSTRKVTTKDSDDSHDAERNQALKKGCSVCGRSILRKRNRLISIENPTKTQQLITKLILASVSREVTVYDRICHPCYQKYERRFKKMQKENPSYVVDSTQSTNTIGINEHADKMQEQINVVAQSDQHDLSLDSDPDWVAKHLKKQSNPSVAKPHIRLLNYKRSPNSSSSCIFYQCKGGTRNKPKEDLRIRVLLDYNYYIPVHSRICSFHLISNDWSQLYPSQNSISTFDSEQIEDIFYLLKKSRTQANFDNLLSVDENLLQFLTGMNKEKFFVLLNEVPEIKNIHRGVCGLVAVLIKHYRHESDDNIASVMNISRSTINRLMTAVNGALTKRGDILEAFVSSKINSRSPYNKQSKL